MSNAEFFERAKKVIPGGVNSPVRAFGKVGGTPRFISRAQGAWLYDIDGKRYIDHVLSWGPLILGHAHPEVVAAVQKQSELGMSFGAPTQLEIELAETISSAIDSIDMVRFVNSGTEATMSAIRLARAYTGRDLIVKFEGCYHGHVDSLLSKAGSGAMTFAIPDTCGVPEDIARTTAVLAYNDIQGFGDFMTQHGPDVAAVIVEPVAANMGVVLPAKGFLENLRQQTEAFGALLIFDEVITGFRLCFGGYQKIAGIRPDLTCLGKIIGGGMPVGAFGGRADIMSLLAPDGPVYQAGTLSGNPMAMAAGLATLRVLRQQDPYEDLSRHLEGYLSELQSEAKRLGVDFHVNQIGSMATLFFHPGPVVCFNDVMHSDADRYARFFHGMLESGVYLAPSPFEAFFISTAHGPDILELSLAAAGKCMTRL